MDKILSNTLKIGLISIGTIFAIGFTTYFIGVGIAKKRVIDLIPESKDKPIVEKIIKSSGGMELVHLYNFFESVHLKVARKDMSKELVSIIIGIGKKYNFDLLTYAK